MFIYEVLMIDSKKMLSYWSASLKIDSSFYHFISNTFTQNGVKRAKNLECQTMRLNTKLCYILLSSRAVIGQFCGSYSTVGQPFMLVSSPTRLINLRAWAINQREKSRSVNYITDRENEVNNNVFSMLEIKGGGGGYIRV